MGYENVPLWWVWADSLSRIADEEASYSVVYKAGLTETYEIWIEQGYTSQILMISTLAQFITIHVVENVHTKQRLVHNIHHLLGWTTPKYPIHYASSRISSSTEIAPSHEISPSVSLLDSEWQNLREYTVLESIILSKRTIRFKEIEYQPWHLSSTQISGDDGRRILAYNKGINEVLSANNEGQ